MPEKKNSLNQLKSLYWCNYKSLPIHNICHVWTIFLNCLIYSVSCMLTFSPCSLKHYKIYLRKCVAVIQNWTGSHTEKIRVQSTAIQRSHFSRCNSALLNTSLQLCCDCYLVWQNKTIIWQFYKGNVKYQCLTFLHLFNMNDSINWTWK